jgi:hypothetical protein
MNNGKTLARHLDTLSELWAAYCARENVECRSADEMAFDESLPRYVQHMARDFGLLWDECESDEK